MTALCEIVDLPDAPLSWICKLGPDRPGAAPPGVVIDRRELLAMYRARLFEAVAVRVAAGEGGRLAHPDDMLRGGSVVGCARAVCLADDGDVLLRVHFRPDREGPAAAKAALSLHRLCIADPARRGPGLSMVFTSHRTSDGRLEPHLVHAFDLTDAPAMSCVFLPVEASR